MNTVTERVVVLWCGNNHLLNTTVPLCVPHLTLSLSLYVCLHLSILLYLSLSLSSCLQDRQNVRSSQVGGDISWSWTASFSALLHMYLSPSQVSQTGAEQGRKGAEREINYGQIKWKTGGESRQRDTDSRRPCREPNAFLILCGKKISSLHFCLSLIVSLVVLLQTQNRPNIATPPPAGSTAVRWADE